MLEFDSTRDFAEVRIEIAPPEVVVGPADIQAGETLRLNEVPNSTIVEVAATEVGSANLQIWTSAVVSDANGSLDILVPAESEPGTWDIYLLFDRYPEIEPCPFTRCQAAITSMTAPFSIEVTRSEEDR